ncbi:hypothetical protein HK098_004577 [Nowakowskiella sp. JEL0407]|nr:hypothetical protein HK098_004577 [Nowakowskiella sp. JEL0407]
MNISEREKVLYEEATSTEVIGLAEEEEMSDGEEMKEIVKEVTPIREDLNHGKGTKRLTEKLEENALELKK